MWKWIKKLFKKDEFPRWSHPTIILHKEGEWVEVSWKCTHNNTVYIKGKWKGEHDEDT